MFNGVRIFLTGMLFCKPEELLFDSDMPYRACLICGDLLQRPIDRNPNECNSIETIASRGLWAEKHARTHTPSEHKFLCESGLLMMPEAAIKLAPFGIVPYSDMLLAHADDDRLGALQALEEAKRLPQNNPIGS